MKIKEDGQAKMSITLDHGFIKVKRTSGLELAKWYANKGDWDRIWNTINRICLLYTSPSPRDGLLSRMPSSA